jgi:hypothetical protein
MTGRLIYADEDGPGWRQRMRRRQADRDFLELVRHGGLSVLQILERNHQNGPTWKRVAIARAIARQKKDSR